MSYFTAVIAAGSNGWRTRDVDVEDAASLDDLADTLRGVGRPDQPVLAVIEHEDEWFALVRVDGEDDPRVFVSDMVAASRGAFADLLSPAMDVESVLVGSVAAGGSLGVGAGPALVDDELTDDEGDAEPAPADVPDAAQEPTVVDGDDVDLADLADLEEDDPPAPPPWAGHVDLLSDLGVPPDVMAELCEEHSDDPATVLGELGEQAGFAELLEALR